MTDGLVTTVEEQSAVCFRKLRVLEMTARLAVALAVGEDDPIKQQQMYDVCYEQARLRIAEFGL